MEDVLEWWYYCYFVVLYLLTADSCVLILLSFVHAMAPPVCII